MNETLWIVWGNTDDTEGRGRQFVKHICETEATARRLARGGYVQGANCPIEQFVPIERDRAKYIPLEFVTIQLATKEDGQEQSKIDRMREAIGKARLVGLTESDIAALQGRL